ncbi:hypothetical protein E2C01_088169 [Portunus trituberculatus]|uniref:Uncharacterized protein n=1 Tax=Portunus trituberculatus TaxID=210409 RepID=A0A5B7JF87_PORTR|nr:hypothetical protein [Portunus trituberculatus]
MTIVGTSKAAPGTSRGKKQLFNLEDGHLFTLLARSDELPLVTPDCLLGRECVAAPRQLLRQVSTHAWENGYSFVLLYRGR